MLTLFLISPTSSTLSNTPNISPNSISGGGITIFRLRRPTSGRPLSLLLTGSTNLQLCSSASATLSLPFRHSWIISSLTTLRKDGSSSTWTTSWCTRLTWTNTSRMFGWFSSICASTSSASNWRNASFAHPRQNTSGWLLVKVRFWWTLSNLWPSTTGHLLTQLAQYAPSWAFATSIESSSLPSPTSFNHSSSWQRRMRLGSGSLTTSSPLWRLRKPSSSVQSFAIPIRTSRFLLWLMPLWWPRVLC